MTSHKYDVFKQCSEYLYPGRIARFLDGGIDFIPDKREGYRYWDLDGRELLDLHLNGGTFNLGHRNPVLIETLKNASAHYDIGNHHFPSEPKGALAQALIEAAPGPMKFVAFTPSGSEANDLAIKCARWVSGKRKVVALDAGYHGRSGLSGAVGDDETARFFHSDYPEEFLKVPFNDLQAMERALKSGDVALVMIEPIPATYGFPLPDENYLRGVKSLCERYGALFLADEVQTGLGRTGKAWAVEHWDVEPDMLVVGKGLSGGVYPMAALLMNERCGAWLKTNGWGHVSTFGGSDLGCVVAQKALELSLAPDTLANVQEQAAYLRAGLEALKPRFPAFVGVRQKGLVMALEFNSPETTWMMLKGLYDHGVWAMIAAFDECCLQFKPGLLIDHAYCDLVLERLEQTLIWQVNHGNDLILECIERPQEEAAKIENIARSACARWLDGSVELSLIKHRENAVFAVTTLEGERYVLRVHRPGYHDVRQLESELLWIEALHDDGFSVPRVVRNACAEGVIEQDGFYCTMLTWVEGYLFNQLGGVPQGVVPELVTRYESLGALAAKLHNQASNWSLPEGFERPRWDAEGLLGDNATWGRFWEHPMLSSQQRLLFLKARTVLKVLLRDLGEGPDCFGLIHCDFLPENILVDGERMTLIDFDDCGFGWHMFEMATSLFPKINEPYFEELQQAYVSGYRSERHFPEEHLKIFPAFLLLRGLTYVGWLMTRADTLRHRDSLAREIIAGLCEHIPDLLDALTPLQRTGISVMAWWENRRSPAYSG